MGFYDSQSASSGLSLDTRFSKMYNNQFFDYLSEQLPKNHKDMFRWCEVLYTSCPSLINGVRKIVNYPLTDFSYESTSDKIRKETKELVEDVLDLRAHLVTLGLDYYTYGNVFRSVYFPFTRYLRCKSCDSEINMRDADFRIVRKKFVLKCNKCLRERTADIVDRQSQDLDKVKLITWNPKNISLIQNPVTSNTTYYYSLPAEIVEGIKTGNKTILCDLPRIFIDALHKNRTVEFGKNFRHLKSPSIAGFSSGWGMSPLSAILKLFFYQSVLRKSNEAIAIEHITPKTILYPEARTSDPTIGSNLSQWREQLTMAMQQWRIDPNYVMFSPMPTGSINIGSQGKPLMPTAEIRQAEEDMILGLDIPLEFVFQKSNINPSPIALRLLENQLTPYIGQLEKYVNWIISTINARFKKSFCKITLTPFKLSDDAYKLQVMQNFTGNTVSMASFMEALGLDPDEEREKLKQERLDQMRDQVEAEQEQAKIQNSITVRSQQENQAAETGRIPQYDQQQLIAQAQQIAMQMTNIPYEERRSMFAQLQNEDYVMYSLVKAQLEAMREAADHAQGESSGAQGGNIMEQQQQPQAQ